MPRTSSPRVGTNKKHGSVWTAWVFPRMARSMDAAPFCLSNFLMTTWMKVWLVYLAHQVRDLWHSSTKGISFETKYFCHAGGRSTTRMHLFLCSLAQKMISVRIVTRTKGDITLCKAHYYTQNFKKFRETQGFVLLAPKCLSQNWGHVNLSGPQVETLQHRHHQGGLRFFGTQPASPKHVIFSLTGGLKHLLPSCLGW